ncbi:MAG: 3-dehydroquinate synthase [Actinomycetota bacterium]|nr:3-dehydroquinate synthase [Actinomycetota bacterium]
MKLFETVEVALGGRSYKIYVGSGILSTIGDRVKSIPRCGRKVIVITNPTILNLFGEVVRESFLKARFEYHFLEVPDGEEYKSLEMASKLYDELLAVDAQRFDPIIAFGGGVIGDLAGFVAATYMRGVPLVQVPTTLLAQVDSSVGGKVAVNHPRGKNLIGCFYQPNFVLTDAATLKTLPKLELKAGFAEVIKYGFLQGEEFLSFLEKNLESILKLDEELVSRVVSECCRIKARIVEEDERDFGRRAILNYGHTIGHAIEALTGYRRFLHGEAISVGMVCAAFIAHEFGLIDRSLVDRHIRLLKRAGLPLKLPELDANAILNQIVVDKKRRGEANIFVLLKAVGSPVVMGISSRIVSKALEDVRRLD